jgi:putative transposase
VGRWDLLGHPAGDQKLCALIVVGVNERGKKRFLAIEDGVRESKQSWREVLIGLKARGLVAPKVAIGDGALGFWSAIDEVFPSTRSQRCWVHKMANVLNYLPRSVQAKAKAGLQAIWMAEPCPGEQGARGVYHDLWCEVSEGCAVPGQGW